MKKVMAFGTFDTIHPGHIFFLESARSLGDYLVVVVSRDKTVSKIKKSKPHNSEQYRAQKIRKLGIADVVKLGNIGDKYKIIREGRPDVIALGYDQHFFVDGLKKQITKKTHIVRLKSFEPEIYKTSRLKDKKIKRIVVILGLIENEGKILMLRRRDSRKDFNKVWEFPGGGIEAGESELDCLRREIKEETGLKVNVKDVILKFYKVTRVARGDYPAYEVYIKLYICKSKDKKVKVSPSEATAFGWYTLREALQEKLFPANKVIIKKHLKLLKKYFVY